MQLAEVLYLMPMLYLIMINIIAFIAMWWDKRKAAHREWRVAEATLYVLGIIGGAVGIFGGMYKLHHKTKKRSFQGVALFGLIISLVIYWYIGMQYV
ncbi:MAG: DUF1294 domain-containing protein [Candidatus Thorarchaeota archaeon]|nr:DUF1294 domain-containing protein [Candidatus Thorarchaeota archaeon]